MGAHQEQYTHGIIAGGMTDGTINIWDPAKLVKAHPQAQLSVLFFYLLKIGRRRATA